MFQATEVNGHLRSFDAEVKLFESLDGALSADAEGVIDVFITKPMCDSCADMAAAFSRRHPKIQLNIRSLVVDVSLVHYS